MDVKPGMANMALAIELGTFGRGKMGRFGHLVIPRIPALLRQYQRSYQRKLKEKIVTLESFIN